MYVKGIIPVALENIKWQDYRANRTGMVVYYNTDPVSEIPIREIPEEIPTDILPEPNYETATFGLYGCKHAKMRSSFAKKKVQYLFFMTRYAGTNIDKAEELIITGFYRIKQTADVKRLHIRYLHEYTCLNEDSCLAFRADTVHFVSVEDAFLITPEILKDWGCSSRITRQSKIFLDEEKTAELVAYLESKKNIVDVYSEETERLLPAFDEEEDEDEEDMEDLLEDAEDYEEDEETDAEDTVSERESEQVREVTVSAGDSGAFTETVELPVTDSSVEDDEETVAEPVQSVIEQGSAEQNTVPETAGERSEETDRTPDDESVNTGFSEMPTQVIEPESQSSSTDETGEYFSEEAQKEETEEENDTYHIDMSNREQ